MNNILYLCAEMTGIYIHIPFCKSRCVYCDFISSTLGEGWQNRYVKTLGNEIRQRRTENGLSHARTIYIGGGTPSLLSQGAFCRLFEIIEENFQTSPETEITLEANPDDITPDFVDRLTGSPVNRISLGVQSLNNDILRFLRRRHTAKQALEAITLLQDKGLENISVDLIYGLPGQSLAMFQNDVVSILNVQITHLSAYALQYEKHTPLWGMRKRGEVQEADEELSLACYQSLMDQTEEAGLEHYEISNFARPGFRSRHNSSYWQGLPYLGFGAGAHSYDGQQIRRANTSDTKAYINNYNYGIETEHLTINERYNEYVMLSLRTCEGCSLKKIENVFGHELRMFCERQSSIHIQNGRIKKTGETLCLTRDGIFVSDGIITDLFI